MLTGKGGQAGRQPLDLQVITRRERRQFGQGSLDLAEQTERLHATTDDLVRVPGHVRQGIPMQGAPGVVRQLLVAARQSRFAQSRVAHAQSEHLIGKAIEPGPQLIKLIEHAADQSCHPMPRCLDQQGLPHQWRQTSGRLEQTSTQQLVSQRHGLSG